MLSLAHATTVLNNLGGVRNAARTHGLRYHHVASSAGQSIDLDVQNLTTYSPGFATPGRHGEFGVINLMPPSHDSAGVEFSEVELRFTFLVSGTEQSVVLPRTSLSFVDLDFGRTGGLGIECVGWGSNAGILAVLSPNTELASSSSPAGVARVCGTTLSATDDFEPQLADAANLSNFARRRTVQLQIQNSSTFDLTLRLSCCRSYGHNFYFTGIPTPSC